MRLLRAREFVPPLGIGLGMGFAIDGNSGTDSDRDPDTDSDPERESRTFCRGGLHTTRPPSGGLAEAPALCGPRLTSVDDSAGRLCGLLKPVLEVGLTPDSNPMPLDEGVKQELFDRKIL